jgi:hypothetical protein
MSKYVSTITSISVHNKAVNPIFGEFNVAVRVEDEGAGPFLVLEQNTDDLANQSIRLDYDEFLAVAQAVKMLLEQTYIEKVSEDSK